MKTRLYSCLAAGLMGAMSLAGCQDEDEKFHAIDIASTGIELAEVPGDPFTLTGHLPAEGATFTLQGQGKYADIAAVDAVQVDGQYCEPAADGWNESTPPPFRGEWGEVVNASDTRPCTMRFAIAPNESGSVRNFVFTVGFGYWLRYIALEQQSRQSPGFTEGAGRP